METLEWCSRCQQNTIHLVERSMLVEVKRCQHCRIEVYRKWLLPEDAHPEGCKR